MVVVMVVKVCRAVAALVAIQVMVAAADNSLLQITTRLEAEVVAEVAAALEALTHIGLEPAEA
jgi:hypothetical protein